MKLFIATIMVIVFFLTGCKTVSHLQSPVFGKKINTISLYRSPIIDKQTYSLRHLNNDKDILYYQTYSDDKAPIKHAINVSQGIKLIELQTIKDVNILNDRVDSNISYLFSKAASSGNFSIITGFSRNSYKLNPYLLIQKTEGELLMLAAVVLMDIGEDYPNKYMIQLPVKYTVEQLSSLTLEQKLDLDALIVNGYTLLLDRIEKESYANISSESAITINSEFLTPRFQLDIIGTLIEVNHDMVWVRIAGGVCGVSVHDLSYTMISG